VIHAAIARDLLALLCGAQGAGTLAIDLNRTHASNSEWTPHARFHLVWQVVSYALLSVLGVALVLTPGGLSEERFYLAATLASIPMLSCFVAFLFRKIYGGALLDSNGIQPVRVNALGTRLQIDMNLAVEGAALLVLGAIVVLIRS